VRVVGIGENRNPVALVATGRRTAVVGTTLSFDGGLSYDPDNDEITHRWEFMLNESVIDALSGPEVSRVFEEVGTFAVELEVRDAQGGVGRSGPQTIVITARGEVDPPPPIPVPTAPEEPPASSGQRPTGLGTCGFGMVMNFFASLLGLSAMRWSRSRCVRRP
jgi:hypothetical protein